MAKRSRPKHETKRQRIHRLMTEGKCGLLPIRDPHPCLCPKRDGPEHPHPDYPGQVWYRTCRDCTYYETPDVK